MLGFLLRLFLVAVILGAVAILFEFRWTGEELKVRSRFSRPAAPASAAPALKAAPKSEAPATARGGAKNRPEQYSEKSRREIETIIQENE